LTKQTNDSMNLQSQLISTLNPHYFWDVDVSGLNDDKACRLIVERVFSLGDMHEMNQVINFFGENKVIEMLCNLDYIDPKTFNFIIKLFNKHREEFRCHQVQQSKPQYWGL
jgi:hypothetical protein